MSFRAAEFAPAARYPFRLQKTGKATIMLRVRSPRLPGRRRGVILLVVLALLTLFALIGITFVLYADGEATAARIYREGESLRRPDAEPELLLAYFLGQLVYDVEDDATGVYSALRGHSLARLLYGNNDATMNATPFNGTGRLHTGPGTFANPFPIDDYSLINYTYFPEDRFLHDPERLGWRAGLDQPRGPFTGGFNPSYTYPDLNNMFLAAVRADGTVLLPSFHRPWTGFGSLDPSNPNWYDTAKPWLKYQVLRPRPADMGPGFPVPEPGGDVKNLVASPGGNDSIWLDLDFPVLTAPDGRKYKPLFAPLIVDLDNRVNLNVHGNVRARGQTHASNQGIGPWEVNLGRVLTQGGNEWANLFVGNSSSIRLGRYGPDRQPVVAGTVAPAGLRPHVYAQRDFDACQELADFLPTPPYQLPAPGLLPWASFPLYPSGYGNDSAAERTNHPLLSNGFRLAGDDRSFALCNMEALLRRGDTGSDALISELASLCPKNFANPRIGRLVTTHSFDLDVPGTIPWLFDRDSSAYQLPLGLAGQPPTGPPIPFPSLALRGTSPIPPSSDFQTPGALAGNPQVDWRSWMGRLGRVQLNRFLPPYPHQGSGLDSVNWSQTPLVGDAGRFDTDAVVGEQFLAAQAARQQLANDIYRRLLMVASVATLATPAQPSDADLAPRRWLAQLAANIVDFLDEDEISTPFQFYTMQDAGDPGFDAGAISAGNAELPRYWVFGTELPRVVLNEVLAEYRLPVPATPGQVPIKVWAELFNPLPAGPAPAGIQPMDGHPVPLYVPGSGAAVGYAPYQLIVANTNTSAGGPLLPRPGDNSNVLGTPDVVRSATTDVDFANLVSTAGDPATPVPARVGPQGSFLLGPPDADARGAVVPPAVPGATPWLRSPNLTFSVQFIPPNTLSPDYRQTGITVLLRRLANPHLPPDPRPAIGGVPNPTYNPYETVDYLSGIPINNATVAGVIYSSWGKRQPYAADASQAAAQLPAVAPTATWHTLGRPNNPVPASGHYDWLVHLDRSLISPMELLQVSGYPPYQLTQRFMSRNPLTGATIPFAHRVPWFDADNRLYRIFEFLEAGWRPFDSPPSDRVAGKININTIWDPETLLALCDPQPANHFTDTDVYNPANPVDPATLYGRLLTLRTPGGAPGPTDRPFLSLAIGHSPKPGDGTYPDGGDPLFPHGSGINDTLLRSATADGGADTSRLFEVPGAGHPYLQFEPLTKLFNNVTTRSNVFAVWLTVAFFEVVDDTTRPVKLGAEIDRAEGRHRRHRMFAVVDRTNLKLFTTVSQTEVEVPPNQSSTLATVTPASMAGNSGRPWAIQVGSLLTVDSGSNQETVRVTAVTPTSFTAVFTRSHAAGFRITGRGNPGPRSRYNPAAEPDVIPYYSIID